MKRTSTAGFLALGVLAVSSASAQDKTQIAFIPQIAGIPYYVAMEEGARRAAEELGVEYVQEGPTSTNAADQLRIFESFVTQGFEGIAISAGDHEVHGLQGALENFALLQQLFAVGYHDVAPDLGVTRGNAREITETGAGE